MLITTLALLMAILAGETNGRECDNQEFNACMLGLEEAGDFGVLDRQQLEEVCNSKKRSLQCAGDFIRDCMKSGERIAYEAVISGKLKVVREMCTQGTRIHQGFLANAECFRKISAEVEFCSDKFKESQSALLKSEELDMRTKHFYGCCAFEWHRKCLASAARAKCGDEASDFVYHVTTELGGDLQEQLCSASYSSCHGLHGEAPQADLGGPRPTPLIPAPLLACLLLLVARLLS